MDGFRPLAQLFTYGSGRVAAVKPQGSLQQVDTRFVDMDLWLTSIPILLLVACRIVALRCFQCEEVCREPIDK